MFKPKLLPLSLLTAGLLATCELALAATSSFALVAMPDTQFYSRYATAAEGNQFMTRYGSEPYAAQTRWLADHAKALNIPFVIHLGDIVDQQNKPAQWGVADAAMKTLEAAKLPYSILAGNHDVINGCGFNGVQNDCTDAQRNLANEPYLKTFPKSRAQKQATFKGRDASGFHEYHVFEAEGQKFLVLSLSWRISDAALTWARNVIAQNPTLPVIVSTHEALRIDSDGVSARQTDYSEFLWNRLIKDNDQIFMFIGGHHHGSAQTVRSNNAGHPVLEMVVDYQMAYMGGNGYLRLYEFDLSNNQIKAISFSPWVPAKPKETLNEFDRALLTEMNHEFTVSMNFAERFAAFNPDFRAAEATREVPITDAARELILANFEDPPPPDAVAPFDSEDYPHGKSTLLHWRFNAGLAGQPVADGALIADQTGRNPLKRAPLAAGALVGDVQWSADRHARSATDGSVCFLQNSNKGLRESFFSTLAGAPANNDQLTEGYTVEAVVKIAKRWTPGNNAWMNILTRDGNRGDVPGYRGGDPESNPLLFAVSSLREFQWEPTVLADGQWTAKANWSGEVMADEWEHVAIVNNPLTHDTTMYVAGAPVLRNVQNAQGIAALNDKSWVVGAGLWGNERTDGFLGCISELRISKTALKSSEWLSARKNRIGGNGARQTLVGTALDDQITSNPGADSISGGAGTDTFVYRSMRDGTDTLLDFTPGEDKLNLHHLLRSVNYTGSDPLSEGWLRVIDSPNGALVQVDTDGPRGGGAFRTLILLPGLNAAQVAQPTNFLF